MPWFILVVMITTKTNPFGGVLCWLGYSDIHLDSVIGVFEDGVYIICRQDPLGTRYQPATRLFFRFSTRPNSVLKIIRYRVTQNIRYYLIFWVYTQHLG